MTGATEIYGHRLERAGDQALSEQLHGASRFEVLLLSGGRVICGAACKWDEIIPTCFDILLDPESYAERRIARLTFDPMVLDGHTLGRPREQLDCPGTTD